MVNDRTLIAASNREPRPRLTQARSNPCWHTWHIKSMHVGQLFRIQILEPTRAAERTAVPIVYTTDANLGFEMLAGIASTLQLSDCDLPPFLLVGIGYPDADLRRLAGLRARDLSFPGYPAFDMRQFGVGRSESEVKSDLTQGMADAFQCFLAEELFPAITGKYPYVSDDRTYHGHSLGGGFGLYTLFTRPRLFRHYVVSSPGLAYCGAGPTGQIYHGDKFVQRLAESFISARQLPGPTDLYVSAGSAEDQEPAVAPWRIAQNVPGFAQFIADAQIPGLNVETEILPAETHMSAWPISFIHGLRSVLSARHRSP